jgi:hypothetical protein
MAAPHCPESRDAGPSPVDRAAKLAGIVHLNPAAELFHEKKYGYSISWVPSAATGLSWWQRLRFIRARRRLALDELGRRTVELIDGRRSIEQIARALSSERSIDLDDARTGLLAFLTGLMRRNVVQVIAPPTADTGAGR